MINQKNRWIQFVESRLKSAALTDDQFLAYWNQAVQGKLWAKL